MSENRASSSLFFLFNGCRLGHVMAVPALTNGLLCAASGCALLQSDEEGGQEKGGEDGQQKFIAHVPVPSQQEVGQAGGRLASEGPRGALCGFLGPSCPFGWAALTPFHRALVPGLRLGRGVQTRHCSVYLGGSSPALCCSPAPLAEIGALGRRVLGSRPGPGGVLALWGLRPEPSALPPADRGGARAEEEDGAPSEVHQRDAAGPERGGQAAPGLLGPSWGLRPAPWWVSSPGLPATSPPPSLPCVLTEGRLPAGMPWCHLVPAFC